MPSGLDNLHRAFSDVMLDLEGEEALLGDPEGFAAERGLGPEDQAAFRRYGRRFATYRALVYCTLTEPLDDSFPLSRGVVGEEAWDAGLREFVASRSIQSYYYRDLQPSFVAWLAESRWGAERWPCLLQLAHYELMEMEILQAPDAPVPQGLGEEAGPASRAVLYGAPRNRGHPYPGHEARAGGPAT